MSALARKPLALAPEDDRLAPRDFDRLAALINDRTGIKMPRSKVSMLESRLRRRVRATGSDSLSDYCQHLFSGDTLDAEIEHLINAVTTNKTDFFREPRQFDYLVDTILPAFAKAGPHRIRVWSAACSTGAEPYTLAMLLDRFCRANPQMSYAILATDLDTEVLETARKGIYEASLLQPVPAALRRDYVLTARDPKRDRVRMAPDLRAAIGFARMNLMDATYPVGEPMDMIFCRNVLIYFDRETQRRVVQRLIDRLKPGGHLFLGHSESIADFDLPLTPVASTLFRKD